MSNSLRGKKISESYSKLVQIIDGVLYDGNGNLVSGASGPQGYQGAIGTGTQGAQGTTGTQGVQGTTGDQGSQGDQGAQGAQGAQGTQGATGSGGSPDFISLNISNAGSSSSGPINLDEKWPYGSFQRNADLDSDNQTILLNIDNTPGKRYYFSIRFNIYNNAAEAHNFQLAIDTGSGYVNYGEILNPIGLANPAYYTYVFTVMFSFSGSVSVQLRKTTTNSISPNYIGNITIFQIP